MKVKKASRLTDLHAHEVSIVRRGANRKKFLVVKEGEAEDKLFDVLDTAAKDEDKLADLIKGMDVEGQTVAKTAYRLLTGFKGKLSPEALISIGKQAGLEFKDPEPAAPKPEGKTQTEIIKSLIGKRKISVKSLAKAAGVEPEIMTNVLAGKESLAETESLAEYFDVDPSVIPAVKKEEKKMPGSIFKADGSLNDEVLPAESRELVNHIWKENQSVKKELDEIKKENKHRAAIAKAEGYKNLGMKAEDLAPLLEEAEGNLSKEGFEKLEKTLQAADKLAGDSEIFTEKGRGGREDDDYLTVDNTQGPATQKLLSKANSLVEKSEGKLEIGDAVNKILKTDRKLYDEYRKETAVRV